MATLTESAPLDLSVDKIKTPSSPINGSVTTASPERMESERSSSVSSLNNYSDGNESDTSTTTAVKPVLGQIMPGSVGEGDKEQNGDRDASETSSSPTPFKMYGMDPMRLYANQALAMASGAFTATVAGSAGSPTPLGLPGLYDSSLPPLPLTPLTSHLLQRKRRAENRESLLEEIAKKTIPVPEEKKDDAYWERRRKNNEAAKRSRDARRMKEEEIAMRAAFLEQENLKLRAQVAILKNETAKLHYMLYNRM